MLDDNKLNGKEQNYSVYLNEITVRWLIILYFVGAAVVPLYSLLDYFKFSYDCFQEYFFYRTFLAILLLWIGFWIHFSKPGKYAYLYGYFFSVIVSGLTIYIMINNTGFNSTYYAGLNLIIISVNLFLPWRFYHAALNGLLIISMYIALNLFFPNEFESRDLINNLSFIIVTVFATIGINYFHITLIESEFFLRKDLHQARDALWGEMELAKKIQVSLLPEKRQIKGYDVTSIMIPAKEVGGDYYDVIEKQDGITWVAFGDVCGHGVESGLFMMMAQTSIASFVKSDFSESPSDVLARLNEVLFENINRLHVERFMTLVLMKLEGNEIVFAGRHMDLLIYRKKSNKIEIISKPGIYIGIVERVRDSLNDYRFRMEEGDVIILCTDGVTESWNADGQMYGQNRLESLFLANSDKSLEVIQKIILEDVKTFQKNQSDDISLMLLKKN